MPKSSVITGRNFSSSSSTPEKGFPNDSLQRVSPQTSTESLDVRGGYEGHIDDKQELERYLQSLGSAATSLDNFYVHGWRWHTRSLIREVGRLHKLALKTSLPNATSLQAAAEYVIDFNLRGLHKIETDLFFPWMRKQLTSIRNNNLETSKAFAAVMTELEGDRVHVAKLGREILQSAALAADAQEPAKMRLDAINAVAVQSLRLQEYASKMKEVEDSFLVPAVAALVPETEQKSFNNKVLRALGVLDSRLHLVGMYEAIVDDANAAKEKELFQKAIPTVPQMMIPRWKRKLYEPTTSMLQ